jgi:hypothetical protein
VSLARAGNIPFGPPEHFFMVQWSQADITPRLVLASLRLVLLFRLVGCPEYKATGLQLQHPALGVLPHFPACDPSGSLCPQPQTQLSFTPLQWGAGRETQVRRQY